MRPGETAIESRTTIEETNYVLQIPPQVGRLAVVTGASSGIGYATALSLAQAGADVIVATNHEAEGREAAAAIRPRAPLSLVRFEKIDLASQRSVADFARHLADWGRPIDMLINNAGIMPAGQRRVSEDGFELQLATNYLGHYALTARLLPLLRRSRHPRVIQVSSLGHRHGRIHFDDLQLEQRYDTWRAYCQSKLAMLLFSRELQQRSDANGWGLICAAAHPGYARTDLLAAGLGVKSLVRRLHGSVGRILSHTAADGALPVLFAATAPNVAHGGYYGPVGPMEFVGPPGAASVARRARDEVASRRLWDVSEELTGVSWAAAS